MYLGGRWIELPWAGTDRAGRQRIALIAGSRPGSAAAASAGGPPRIALAHSPDQLPARRHQVDLLLAGHLHGGQIHLPVLGPVLSPSRSGVTYASGTFHDPPTVIRRGRPVGRSCDSTARLITRLFSCPARRHFPRLEASPQQP